MPAGLYIGARLAFYHSVIRPAVCAMHGPCLSYVMDVTLSDYNVVNQMILYSFLWFRLQCWMTSPPRFADKPGWSQLCLGNFLYPLLQLERAVLPLKKATSDIISGHMCISADLEVSELSTKF